MMQLATVSTRIYEVAQRGGGRFGRRDRRPLDVETRRGRRAKPLGRKNQDTYQRALEAGFELLGIEPPEPPAEPIHPPSEQDFRRWGQRELIPFEFLGGETPCREERCSVIAVHPVHIRIE